MIFSMTQVNLVCCRVPLDASIPELEQLSSRVLVNGGVCLLELGPTRFHEVFAAFKNGEWSTPQVVTCCDDTPPPAGSQRFCTAFRGEMFWVQGNMQVRHGDWETMEKENQKRFVASIHSQTFWTLMLLQLKNIFTERKKRRASVQTS
jgi:hypothetical protein